MIVSELLLRNPNIVATDYGVRKRQTCNIGPNKFPTLLQHWNSTWVSGQFYKLLP